MQSNVHIWPVGGGARQRRSAAVVALWAPATTVCSSRSRQPLAHAFSLCWQRCPAYQTIVALCSVPVLCAVAQVHQPRPRRRPGAGALGQVLPGCPGARSWSSLLSFACDLAMEPMHAGCCCYLNWAMLRWHAELPAVAVSPLLLVQGRVTPADTGEYSFAKYNKKVGSRGLLGGNGAIRCRRIAAVACWISNVAGVAAMAVRDGGNGCAGAR